MSPTLGGTRLDFRARILGEGPKRGSDAPNRLIGPAPYVKKELQMTRPQYAQDLDPRAALAQGPRCYWL